MPPIFKLYAAGSNSGGQLGLGSDEDAHTLLPCFYATEPTQQPEPFPPLGTRVVALDSGANHTLAILEHIVSGTEARPRELWATGDGAAGQLGAREYSLARPGSQGGVGASKSQKRAHVFRRLWLDADLQLHALLGSPSNFNAGSQHAGIIEYEPSLIACGWETSYIVLRSTAPPAFADQRHGDLPIANSAPRGDILISLGSANDFGQLGIARDRGSTSQAAESSAVVNRVPLAHLLAGFLSSETSNEGHQPVERKSYRINALAAGLRHAVATLESVPMRSGPIRERSSTTCALIGWGAARHGQVGEIPPSVNSTTSLPSNRSRPAPAIVPVPQVIKVYRKDDELEPVPLAAGRDHTAALLPSETFVFGSDRLGQCALRNPPGQGWHSTLIDCTWNGTMMLLERNSDANASEGKQRQEQMICTCGGNAKGQRGASYFGPSPAANGSDARNSSGSASALDQSDTLAEGISRVDTSEMLRYHSESNTDMPRIVQIACGSEHALTLVRRQIDKPSADVSDSQSEVWGWGWNEHGNLAQGGRDERDRCKPTRIWPSPVAAQVDETRKPCNIWAGCGTSFIQFRLDGNAAQTSPAEPMNAADESQDFTPAALSFANQLPKVELHAHLNGSIRRSTLQELASRAGLDDSHAHIVQGDARSLSEMFAVFEVIHKSVRGAQVVRRIAREVLEDFESDGVIYAEIRTTPKAHHEQALSKEGYIQAVLKGFEDYAQSRAVGGDGNATICRLLLSIDRAEGSIPAEETVDLALKYRHRGVVGIDLSGNPSVGTFDTWRPALQRAKQAGLKTTLHAGEVPDKDEEMEQMLAFRPVSSQLESDGDEAC